MPSCCASTSVAWPSSAGCLRTPAWQEPWPATQLVLEAGHMEAALLVQKKQGWEAAGAGEAAHQVSLCQAPPLTSDAQQDRPVAARQSIAIGALLA